MKLSSLVALLAVSLAAVSAHASPSKGTMVAFPVVQPGTAVMFSGLEFRAGEVTDVWAGAKGGSIDCHVFNDKGAIVAKDEGSTNGCSIKVTPKKTGTYTVLVTNVDSREPATVTLTIQ